MPESDQTPPPPPEDDRTPRQKPGDPRRPERQSSSNLIWYLLFTAVGAVFLVAILTKNQGGDKLDFSEFEQKLDDGVFNPTNVYELVIGPEYITFQDHPQQQEAGGRSDAETVRKFRIQAYAVPDEKKAELTRLLARKKITYNFTGPPPEWPSLVMM